MPEKAPGKADKENKDKYLHTYLKGMRHFSLLFFSSESILGSEAPSATRQMASHLRFNLKQEYLEMFGFLRVRMALEIVWSNTLVLWVPLKIYSHIRQNPYLIDGSLMALLVP